MSDKEKEWQTWLQFECLQNKKTGNSTYVICTYLLYYRDVGIYVQLNVK
jgi:hypothetical protein